jgi:Domain of unknown function (DUF4158)
VHRGEYMRAGFALQLTTVRWLGTFLEDPLDVPREVLDFIAGQLGMADPSQVKRYTEQELTKQQAELLKVQPDQLELQRKQFDKQRQVNVKQIEVLELQAACLQVRSCLAILGP